MTAIELIKAKHHGTVSLLLITHDLAAQRVAAAWTCLEHPNIDRPIKKNEPFSKVAQEIWGKAHASFSMEDLANQADVPFTRCEKIFFRMIRAGIVYPDGTISQPAADLLDGQARAHIRGLIPKRSPHGRN